MPGACRDSGCSRPCGCTQTVARRTEPGEEKNATSCGLSYWLPGTGCRCVASYSSHHGVPESRALILQHEPISCEIQRIPANLRDHRAFIENSVELLDERLKL